MLVSHAPKPRSSIQTKSVFYTKKERKEAVDIHLHRPNPRSAKFSLLEPCKRNQEKNRRKKKLQPASQQLAKGFLRISRQRNPSSTKRRKKLRNFRKFLHVQTKFTSCQFSSRTMKNVTKKLFRKKTAVSEPSTSFVPFSWHTNTWNTSHHRFAQSRIQSSAPFTKTEAFVNCNCQRQKKSISKLLFFWRIREVENESLLQQPKSAIDFSQFPKKLTRIWCQIHAESEEEEEDARLRN